ncbi:MAG TPA: DNA-processing protein DprA [bacterium]|nr:DNA-processing protein DprA [bacterium]
MIVLRTDNPLHPDNFLRLTPAIGVPLWMEGMFEAADSRAIAIVGTRKPSLYGIELARDIATTAAKNGITVVSGMARGIDTEAHRAALAAGGRTIAVLGTGLENIYPEENIALARDIAKCGAVITQFPPETTPRPRNFPIRNATIALLSNTTVIVEAGTRSGSLITGRHAVETGRPVQVVAGPLDDENFRGNYEFLKKYEGNRLVSLLAARDGFLADLPAHPAAKKAPAVNLEELDPIEQAVVRALTGRGESCSFDDITETTGLPAATLPAVLLPLVLKGVIAEEPGNRYRIT